MFNKKHLVNFLKGGEVISISSVLICSVAAIFPSEYTAPAMESLLWFQLVACIIVSVFFFVAINDYGGVDDFCAVAGALACSIVMIMLYYRESVAWEVWFPLLAYLLLKASAFAVRRLPTMKAAMSSYFGRT